MDACGGPHNFIAAGKTAERLDAVTTHVTAGFKHAIPRTFHLMTRLPSNSQLLGPFHLGAGVVTCWGLAEQLSRSRSHHRGLGIGQRGTSYYRG